MNAGEVMSLVLTVMAAGMNVLVACLLNRRARRLEEWQLQLIEEALELARLEGAAEDGKLFDAIEDDSCKTLLGNGKLFDEEDR